MFAATGKNRPFHRNIQPDYRPQSFVLPGGRGVYRQARVAALQVKVFGGEAEVVSVGKEAAVKRQPGVVVGIIEYVRQLLPPSVPAGPQS